MARSFFDGEGNYRLFDVMAADHHYFEGLTIVNTEIAFLRRAQTSAGLLRTFRGELQNGQSRTRA